MDRVTPRPDLNENALIREPHNGDRPGSAAAPVTAADPSIAIRRVLDATRDLLWVRSPADAQRIAERLVLDLGAEIVPATPPHRDAIPADLSFGSGEPVVPAAPPDSPARDALEHHLGQFLHDARRAIETVARVERLKQDATVDLLTGLPNRRMLARSLARLEADDAVIMIDLDHFKRVNDEFGHVAGDEVLRTFGEVMRRCARSRDIVGRYGGEEFLVIMHPAESATLFLDRLRHDWKNARPQPISFSAGVARSSDSGEETLRRADAALYIAKRTGRDRWILADDPTIAEQVRPDDPVS